MNLRASAALSGAAALALAVAAPVAAGPTIEVLAEGLEAPRGVAIGSDGAVYVAEAGAAGEQCPEEAGGFCFGPTGAISRIADGSSQRIVEGLPSAGNEQEVVGVSDLVVRDDGSLLIIVNSGGDPAGRAEGSLNGWLASVEPGATPMPVADVAAFESTDNPDAESNPTPDANPHSIAIVEGGTLVADSGGNDLLLVGDDGAVSLVALLPPTVHEYTPEQLAAMGPPPGAEADALAEDGPMGQAEQLPAGGPPETIPVPVESVPTSVVVGPDGAYYVGELTGGPFPAGGASVYRIVPGQQPEIYATGFSAIMDLGFGPDGTLYVAELVHDGLLPVFAGQAPPIGAIMAVPAGGGDPTMVASGEQLMAIGGMAVADDGTIYASANTLMPGAGTLVRITP